jgi:glycosyltransferase involved in cell wall biosynthesis
MPFLLTAVIPTRGRPDDLRKAILSVVSQSRRPSELIIVDQSPDDSSRKVVEPLLSGCGSIHLIYILDSRISGLVDAKRFAVEKASGNIICFLEDDIVLESDYFEQLERGFERQPEMLGCCGIVTNPPKQPFGYSFVFHLFHRGIFRDKRVGVYGRYSGRGNALIPSQMISGGMSAWKREVFNSVQFDVANGFHLLEDNDFSTRVVRHFGAFLYINPNARLEHRWSPINRDGIGAFQRRKVIACVTYYKKRRNWSGAGIAFLWLLVGMFFEAVFRSAAARSVSPIQGFCSGLRDGIAKVVV